jgi:hypothetical protein
MNRRKFAEDFNEMIGFYKDSIDINKRSFGMCGYVKGLLNYQARSSYQAFINESLKTIPTNLLDIELRVCVNSEALTFIRCLLLLQWREHVLETKTYREF